MGQNIFKLTILENPSVNNLYFLLITFLNDFNHLSLINEQFVVLT